MLGGTGLIANAPWPVAGRGDADLRHRHPPADPDQRQATLSEITVAKDASKEEA